MVRTISFRKTMACMLIWCMLVNVPLLWALDDTNVISTQNAGVGHSGNTTTVDVLDSRAIVNWDSLDTFDYETLEFIRGGNLDFAVLNRVFSGSATSFNGILNGNQGHIIIVNPNGVIFGPTAIINAAQFTASGLNVNDTNAAIFMANGNLIFEGGVGNIKNAGAINADKVALIGKKVLNAGTIVSNGGSDKFVLLASGDKVVISDNDVLITLPAGPPAPTDTSTMEPGDVTNTGTVTNPGGKIILAAGDTYAQAVENLGSLGLTVEGTKGNVRQYGTLEGGSVTASAVGEVAFYEDPLTTTTVGGEVKISGESALIEEDLTSATDMTIDAAKTIKVLKGAKLTSSSGNMALTAQQQTVTLTGGAEAGNNMDISAGTYIWIDKDLVSGNDMNITTGLPGPAYGIHSSGNFQAGDDLNLNSDLTLWGGQWVDNDGFYTWEGDQSIEAVNGTVTAEGYIHKLTPGQLFITGGADVPEDAVDLKYDGEVPTVSTMGNMYIHGKGNVQISGDLTAMGEGYEPQPPGKGDFPYTYDDKGGVSVISDNGKIYTEGASPDNDTLAIGITGYSNDVMLVAGIGGEGIGVDLPVMDSEGNAQGKAAIVLKSKETLKLGNATQLHAYGMYKALILQGNDLTQFFGIDGEFGDVTEIVNLFGGIGTIEDLLDTYPTITDFYNALYDTIPDNPFDSDKDTARFFAIIESIYYGDYGVDDRPGIDFLAVDDVIGGYDRDKGIPSDIAIYAASTAGDVIVDTADVYVHSYYGPRIAALENGYYEGEGLATVVYDAYGSVFMPFLDDFEGYYNYRLEVCSRITEWLSEAIANGTLPYADNPDFMKQLYEDYVLRGAGDYPDSPDQRAWVLEDPPPANLEAAPLANLEIPKLKGCPAELEAVAIELGISKDQLQMSIGNSLSLNPNIQPCDACATLLKAATALKDIDGTRLAAMNQVFGALAPADAPFTPEMSAAIVTAFSEMTDTDTQYALAMEYVDAFVNYVAVLDTQLGSPVGDSVAFVMEKHGSAVSAAENANIMAYVLSRLEAR